MRQPVMEKVLEKPEMVMVRSRHARQRGEADVLGAVVEEVLVHLVGEDEEVVLDGERGDGLELGEGEDLAGGVGRAVEDDGAGARRDGGAEASRSSAQSGAASGTTTGSMRMRVQRADVVAVEGLEEQDSSPGLSSARSGGVAGLRWRRR